MQVLESNIHFNFFYTMKLTITATLTEEEVEIIASEKWYQKKVFLLKEGVTVGDTHNMDDYEEVNNPQTPADFIVSVYQSMIVNDATKVFTDYRTQQLKAQIVQTEELVKTDVETAITSSIE